MRVLPLGKRCTEVGMLMLYFQPCLPVFKSYSATLSISQIRTLSSPITTLRWALTYADPGTYQLVDVLVVGVVLLAVMAGVRMLRPSYAVYAIASLLVPLCYWASFRPLLSMPRLVVVVFPAFWVLARATERRLLPEPLVTGAFAAGYGILLVLFVNWWHIF